ncbi:MAG TPA: hypothetical protein VIS75_10395, partial [Chitinophagaceae bacterium]
MLKQVSIYSLLLVMLASCSSLKTAFTGTRESASTLKSNSVKKETKFLDQIDVPVESSTSKKEDDAFVSVVKKESKTTRERSYRKDDAENLSQLQVKYSVLLNTPAEEVRHTKMFEFIDDWYGTPYRLGGTTKK